MRVAPPGRAPLPRNSDGVGPLDHRALAHRAPGGSPGRRRCLGPGWATRARCWPADQAPDLLHRGLGGPSLARG
eukprot:2413015-Lingulodinium_polyedra.AAC.1